MKTNLIGYKVVWVTHDGKDEMRLFVDMAKAKELEKYLKSKGVKRVDIVAIVEEVEQDGGNYNKE